MTGKLPYWMHQLIEYLLGVLLLSQAARLERPLWAAIAGVALVLAAALGDAPLSAFRTVPRPVHRIVDVVLGVVLVALGALVVPGAGRVMVLVAGAAVLVLAWRTDFRPKGPKVPLRDRLPDSRTVGQLAGRGVGKAVVAGRRNWRARK